MKIFDIHVHIYPDQIAPKAVAGISQAYNSASVQNDGRLSTVLRLMDEAQIDQFAAHSVATTPHQVDSINHFVMEAYRAHSDRIVPFATLHPAMPNPKDAVKRVLDEGFRGIKLHPEFQSFKVDDDRAMELFAAIGEDLPILMHCGDYRIDNSAPERIKHLKAALPSLRLICAHLGGWTNWEAAAACLKDTELVFDLSSSLYALDDETSESIIRAYGVENVLFGSDYPMWTPGEELSRFMKLNFTAEEREAILWKNHERLL